MLQGVSSTILLFDFFIVFLSFFALAATTVLLRLSLVVDRILVLYKQVLSCPSVVVRRGRYYVVALRLQAREEHGKGGTHTGLGVLDITKKT